MFNTQNPVVNFAAGCTVVCVGIAISIFCLGLAVLCVQQWFFN